MVTMQHPLPLWQRKIAACQALLALTLELEERLKGDDADGVAGIVGRRGELMAAVDLIDRQFPEKASQGESGHCEGNEAPQELASLLRRLAQADERCLTLAKVKLETIRREMDKLQRGQRGLEGYGRKAVSPRFLSVWS